MSTVVDSTPFYKKLAFNLLSLSILGVILYLGQDILKPLFFAILLSVLLLPVIDFFQRIKFNRVLSIIIAMLLAAVVILAIIYFLSRQVFSFLDDFDNVQKRMEDLFSSFQEWINSVVGVTVERQDEYIDSTEENVDAAKIVSRTFVSFASLLSYIVFLPVYTFLTLYYKDRILKFFVAVFNGDNKVREILSESRAVSHQYIMGLLIVLVTVFILNSTGFLILGIKYAVFLALVAALLNLIPYIGMLIANIFCMLITFMFSENIYDVVWVGAILAAVQLIENNFLVPLIIGSKVKINALATLLAVVIGGTIWGVAGMFLSIPTVAVLKVIFDRVDGLKPYGILLGDETVQPPDKGKTKKIPK